MPAARLVRILHQLQAATDSVPGPARLCEGCAEIMGMTGAGIMLMSGEVPRGSICSSNAVSALIEDLQYTLGEGPCVEAYEGYSQDKPETHIGAGSAPSRGAERAEQASGSTGRP